MSGEISTIQSLKAVDAWIDVINANINGGVRTAFKASRLKFSGSNTDVDRPGNSTSLPLQFPEPGLTTANTVIDFTQGAITASTENTHLAIQGTGFFLVVDPNSMNADGTLKPATASSRLYLTRDGEFHANQNGVLVNSAGYYLVSVGFGVLPGQLQWDNAAQNGVNSGIRAVYDDLDIATAATVATRAIRLSTYLTNQTMQPATTVLADGVTVLGAVNAHSLLLVQNGMQSLKYSTQGSTVFDPGFQYTTGALDSQLSTTAQEYSGAPATILSKSLEASNSSMTQSVPELSLAQKLFSALTKVLQTKQTNVDGVLNLVR